MFCMHCGQALPPDAGFCPNCGGKAPTASKDAQTGAPAVSAQASLQKENGSREFTSYLGFAVVMAVLGCLCCTPLTLVSGIVAVLFASQASGYAANGNCTMAVRKARTARIFCWIAFSFLAVYLFAFAALIRYSDEISEFLTEKITQERTEGENNESAEPDHHHIDYSLLWDIID